MEYYSAIKNKDTVNIAGNWIQQETIILSEVTQFQKDMHVFSHLKVNNIQKVKDIHTIFHRHKETKNEGSNDHGCIFLRR